MPDGQWSDHAGGGAGSDGGPGWVAAIINAVGGYDNDHVPLRQNPCTDTINGQQYSYWQDTVILITWDDWGGFYDDVVPPIGYTNNTGGQYVYGFRVPLLVVSAYAGTYNGTSWSGYIFRTQNRRNMWREREYLLPRFRQHFELHRAHLQPRGHKRRNLRLRGFLSYGRHLPRVYLLAR